MLVVTLLASSIKSKEHGLSIIYIPSDVRYIDHSLSKATAATYVLTSPSHLTFTRMKFLTA